MIQNFKRKKPGPTSRYRAKRRRAEGPVAKRVRQQCDDRDGYCRMGRAVMGFNDDTWTVRSAVDACEGPSQWAHLGDGTRAKTRGMKPEQRHHTTHSLMLCRLNHDRYDGRDYPRLTIRALTESGADGRSTGVFMTNHLRRLWCGWRGHDWVLIFTWDRLSLHCVTCDHDSPGWEIH